MPDGNSSWKLTQAACEYAEEQGEEVAKLHGFLSGPVDPFRVIAAERSLLHVAGEDFGDAFDGRLSYVGPRFLLCYNTKYDGWPHKGLHHPKVRFTIAHELGHFFLDEHRRALVLRGATHLSFTEFASSNLVERQADCFASGFLLPRNLLGPQINFEPEPDLVLIRKVANEFDVSLTSMLVRWAQVSDFPCATLCVRDGRIQWGFVSKAFRDHGGWRARRNSPVRSADALAFGLKTTPLNYREGQGGGVSADWIEGPGASVPLREFYAAIPSSSCVMVFLSADEMDLESDD